MAFNELEKDEIDIELTKFIEKRRPPENLREQVDLAYKVDKQNVLIYEIRKNFQTKAMIDMPIAKATYVMKDSIWKIYWQRADLKWHLYEPAKEVKSIRYFLKVVDEDKFGCFWG